MLNVVELDKNYGKRKILEQVSFQIQRGEVVGLVGENGAGKSTLLTILATITKPTKGAIELNNVEYSKKLDDIRKMIGYVPQEISVWEEFTVEQNMLFFEKLSWKRHTKEECRQLCLDMQLSSWKEKVKDLSGGMMRKLNIAISLLNDPSLILLDEPTVGIDMKSKNEIGKYLVRLAKEQGKIILYTSHDMNEVITFCDRVYAIGQDSFYINLLQSNGVKVEKL
ncbi:ABC transporter ATP-binding protein [Ureibacillus massiliensis 4400831 = CIP 108448 = CCUG 49529]|uniref:ABC transporter ATP-binding protein n=1 Tax=Ureibacillus massiliensis 4400831 = CIP 108448 = CCUG 49529 TaxID=1211035 RepID=A0A0A3J4G4_9BACL|nr:ABC transporter ATP-binding protein [Ureibacillus massiliensis]KGR91914.1 ABC transporter ATP-binding protein [Ureibacillus massiliensis 4400831 = CIP 108448 = CCUG 49529]